MHEAGAAVVALVAGTVAAVSAWGAAGSVPVGGNVAAVGVWTPDAGGASVAVRTLVRMLLLSGFGTYQAYHYTDSTNFCGLACHQVMKPE